jgi:hypothetical protein
MSYDDLQKARLARIQMAKINSRNAFIANKRKVEERLLMLASNRSGLPPPYGDKDDDVGADYAINGDDIASRFNTDDLFQLQHHHLLACLEKTTVGDQIEIQLHKCRIDHPRIAFTVIVECLLKKFKLYLSVFYSSSKVFEVENLMELTFPSSDLLYLLYQHSPSFNSYC